MAEDRNPVRLAADIGGAIGFVGLVVAAIMWLLSLPLLAVVAVGLISFGALVVGILIHVFFSNSMSFQTIGEWRQGYSLPAKKERGTLSRSSEPPPPKEASGDRLVSLKELEELYEPLKKREPNFVDLGNEYVSAYNDEKGVIVRGVSSDKESFHVLVQSFGNEYRRSKVRSLHEARSFSNVSRSEKETT